MKKADNKVSVLSPVGIINFPYLITADSGRPMSDNKWKMDFYISKDKFKTDGKPLVDAVLQVARAYFGKPTISLKDFKNPFVDTDTLTNVDARLKGHVRLRVKSTFKPLVVGPGKEELSEDAIKNIKGGDLCRFVGVAYPYSQQGGGVTIGLNVVQFVRSGDALGGGASAMLSLIDEIEVPLEDPTETQETESVSKPQVGGKGKASNSSARVVDQGVSALDDNPDSALDMDFGN